MPVDSFTAVGIDRRRASEDPYFAMPELVIELDDTVSAAQPLAEYRASLGFSLAQSFDFLDFIAMPVWSFDEVSAAEPGEFL